MPNWTEQNKDAAITYKSVWGRKLQQIEPSVKDRAEIMSNTWTDLHPRHVYGCNNCRPVNLLHMIHPFNIYCSLRSTAPLYKLLTSLFDSGDESPDVQ